MQATYPHITIVDILTYKCTKSLQGSDWFHIIYCFNFLSSDLTHLTVTPNQFI